MNLIKISVVTPGDTELYAVERETRARELMKKGVGV